ncbi:MAG: hypothetical protein KGJ35_03260 [Patescibacteria group bacterium]|nr:hypothetical protein [Patescibacteria group bacterium]
MEPNKGQNHIPIDQSFWRTIGLISGDEHLFYIFKKTERIVTALYLVTNLIKDNDPLKWEIRERCMSLVSSTIALTGADNQEKNSFLRFFLTSLLESRTFVNISLGSNIISQMNAEMIIGEIDSLVVYVKDRALESANKAGYVLSRSFFSTETPSRTDDKGQSKDQVKVSQSQSLKNVSSSVSFKKSQSVKQVQKDNRKESILKILSKQGNLTIKDIIKDITNCSEKTLQRVLIDLIQTGLVKKEGDRRWSRYSLK